VEGSPHGALLSSDPDSTQRIHRPHILMLQVGAAGCLALHETVKTSMALKENFFSFFIGIYDSAT